MKKDSLLFKGTSWDIDIFHRIYDAIEPIACQDLGLSVYENEQRIVTAPQMIDAYVSSGLPSTYGHWSFGKRYVQQSNRYKRGQMGLAYELVINSDPCISYYMLENTAALQVLTTAHAAFGHNHFFKNNYLFKEWTDAKSVCAYFKFAQDYIIQCEKKYGYDRVECILDAAHALAQHSMFQHKRHKLSSGDRERKKQKRYKANDKNINELWLDTVPKYADSIASEESESDFLQPKLPEENLLYFIEKYASRLEGWEREIIRIVRKQRQYFYPQFQTKMINEGCASFIHYYICNKLFDQGKIDSGTMIEILCSHTNVLAQIPFESPMYSGINPYKLGFEMCLDLRRICENPTPEDEAFLPSIAGLGDWRAALRDMWSNFRDDSCIIQFLSPNLIRKFRLFEITDYGIDADFYEVSDIHNDDGYDAIRNTLARSYSITNMFPNIQVVDASLTKDRTLLIKHSSARSKSLEHKHTEQTLEYLYALWKYPIILESYDKSDNIHTVWNVSSDGKVTLAGKN